MCPNIDGMGSNHFCSSPGLVEDTRNLPDLQGFLTKKNRAYGILETWNHHHWMPVKYRDLISVSHLGSRTQPCWATWWTSWRRTWGSTAGCKIRRFSDVLNPDINSKWLKWSIWATGDGGGGVPCEEQHQGPLQQGQEGRQLMVSDGNSI